jgi:hypothetical protein
MVLGVERANNTIGSIRFTIPGIVLRQTTISFFMLPDFCRRELIVVRLMHQNSKTVAET